LVTHPTFKRRPKSDAKRRRNALVFGALYFALMTSGDSEDFDE
jgi:hypothetical protein